MTVIARLTLVAPPLFVPVTVYEVEAVIAVGVPVITPVVVLRESPEGKAGETP